MSSTAMPRLARTSISSSPKSSPTGPTGRTSVKKRAASEKWTEVPPSIRSRSPNGVRTEMKAIQIAEFGGPEVLSHVDLPDPTPGEGEVLVEVARSGINFADTHATRND